MSAIISAYLKCDGPGCDKTFGESTALNASVAVQRVKANREANWARNIGKDLCDTCRKSKKTHFKWRE